MEYTAKNNETVSTTSDVVEETKNEKWNIDKLYSSEFTLDSLVNTLQVLDVFKMKYPNDETIQEFEDIVRDEICQLFDGSIL